MNLEELQAELARIENLEPEDQIVALRDVVAALEQQLQS
ncbi:MAG: hypothetical protein RIQ37_297 [Actinomycetota bacterium]|jgi:hypothetical protein